jgi:hypothetical protein
MRLTPLFLIAASIVSVVLGKTNAANCIDNRDYYQSLPTVIGREDQVEKLPFALNCDTVYVRKGVTTVVYPGTLLYFARPSLNSVIKVEGTLLIKGTKNSYVSLSGSLDSTRFGVDAGNRQWGGIEVAEGGRLEVEYAGFMRAPTPITAFSRQVKLTNTWFKGSSGMILPDGSLYPMESGWHAVNDLDLSKRGLDRKASDKERPADAISEKEKEELLERNGTGYWTWPKVAGGAALLAVIGVGASVYLTPDKAGANSPPVITPKKESTMDKLPELPK